MTNLLWSSPLAALLLWVSALSLLPSASALLEERFVAFSESDGSISIHNAVIIHDVEDPAGIQIAANSLVKDFEQITGNRPRNATYDGGLGSSNGTMDTAVLIGTIDSELIKAVVENADLDLDDLEDKWETFKTAVVSEPLEGVGKALVIAGSDMRGTAFGVYTLAEQCGQSP